LYRNSSQIQFNSIVNKTEVLVKSPEFTIVIGGPQGFSATGSVSAIGSGIPNSGSVLILASATPPPALTTGGGSTSKTAAGASTPPGTGQSIGNASYGSRGLAIAMGIIGVGLTAMFVVV
jgi:hypothetical protein